MIACRLYRYPDPFESFLRTRAIRGVYRGDSNPPRVARRDPQVPIALLGLDPRRRRSPRPPCVLDTWAPKGIRRRGDLLGGASLNYRTSLGIVSHAFSPGIISSVLFLLVLYLKPFGTVDLENPVATNVGALLAEGSAKWLQKLGSSLDIFSFWTLYLIALGFAAASPKKLTLGKSLGIAVAVWAIYVLVRVGWALAFS